MAAPCCSTRSARWTRGCRPSCCASIQEREVDRLGGTAPVKVDVRLLAATNRDLGAEVARGASARTSGSASTSWRCTSRRCASGPATSRRWRHYFARRFAAANGLPLRAVSPAAEALLLAHPWPGNVRELENTLHRAVLLAEGGWIGPEAIELTPPLTARRERAAGRRRGGIALAGRPADGGGGARPDHRDADPLPRQPHPRREILGISIRTLRNKLQEYRAQGAPVPARRQRVAAAAPTRRHDDGR